MRTFAAHRYGELRQSEIRRMTLECERVGGINMAQGLCDIPIPDCVRDAGVAAMQRETQPYSSAAGIPELRHALARRLERDNGLHPDPEREIVVTSGVTGAYHCTLDGLLNPGDGILLIEPYYGYHLNMARVAGLDPHFARPAHPHATIDENLLRNALLPHTRAIVVCTPSNPAGKVWSLRELEGLARVATERDLLVITDEIYEYFAYDGRAHISPARLPELWPRTVSLLGYSKTFAITGWRIGCAVAPAPLAERILLANDLTFICAPRPLQHAVAAAIDTLPQAWYRELATQFEARRDRVCDALERGGLPPVAIPEGSYYVMADASAFESARTAAMSILDGCGVATVPGTAFMRGAEGERFVRVCYAKQDRVLDLACQKLSRFVPSRSAPPANAK